MTLTNQIPCYYINMDRSPQRRTFMEQQFAQAGLSATRISGVDGRAMDSAEREALQRHSDLRTPLSAEEVGCILSHKKAWQLIAQADAPFGVVFEDDVVLSSALPSLMKGSDWVPTDCYCLKIDTSVEDAFHHKKRSLCIAPFYLTKPIGRLLATSGYVISQHGAKMLLEKSGYLKDPVDVFMYETNDPDLAYMQLHPAVCIQAQLYSGEKELPKSAKLTTIENRRQTKARRMPFGPKKVLREFLRMLRPITRSTRPLMMAITARAFRYSVIFKE